MKVLAVDDDEDLLDITSYALRREGYTVVAAVDGHQALERFDAEHPDIVLLDVNLPRLSGFDVCRRIRETSNTPIIMLTARDEEADVVSGLRLGADDYVTKPFSARQLSARMSAVLRRSQFDSYLRPAGAIRVKELVLDTQSHEASKAGKRIHLTTLEFRILYLLALNSGHVVPYSRLVEYAWGYDGGDASLLKTHICHIRKKLRSAPGEHGVITAVPEVGYKLA